MLSPGLLGIVSYSLPLVGPQCAPFGGHGPENDMASLNRDSIKTDVFHIDTLN